MFYMEKVDIKEKFKKYIKTKSIFRIESFS